ncbi:penicillin-binding protein 1C, partial [Rhizobium ruizarguesonis]
GLAIGLGGVGITLKDLVKLYTALANRGQPARLCDGVTGAPGKLDGEPLLEPVPVCNVAYILSADIHPAGAPQSGIAY